MINELLAPTQQRKDVVLSHVMASSARRRTELYMKKKEKKRKASLARAEKWVKPDEGGFKRPPRSPDSGLARQAMSAGDQTNSLRSARDDSGRRDDSSSAPGVPLAGVASLEAASSFLSVASERSCESDDNQSPRKGSAMVSVDSADESGGATERATGHSDDNDDDDALSSSDDDLYYGDSDSEDESFNPDDWNDSVHMMHDDGTDIRKYSIGGALFESRRGGRRPKLLVALLERHRSSYF